jgi:hypothetical protein
MALPSIVAYYTRGTGYEEAVELLIGSLRRCGLQFSIRSIPDLGGWFRNTHFKAIFLLETLRRLQRCLLYLDADSVLHERPRLLETLDADIAVHYRELPNDAPAELLSGTIYLRPGPATYELLGRWINFNTARPVCWDQVNLDAAICHTPGLRVGHLPREYAFIFDSMRKESPDARPVIEHFQASRRFRNKQYFDSMGFPVVDGRARR